LLIGSCNGVVHIYHEKYPNTISYGDIPLSETMGTMSIVFSQDFTCCIIIIIIATSQAFNDFVVAVLFISRNNYDHDDMTVLAVKL
jgi:hypothetical protein